jgi:hypothetical protein
MKSEYLDSTSPIFFLGVFVKDTRTTYQPSMPKTPSICILLALCVANLVSPTTTHMGRDKQWTYTMNCRKILLTNTSKKNRKREYLVTV